MLEWKQIATTLKAYKQRQRISYPAIARALGLKERQVYYIFQGKGDLLNSYALLRQLSQVLAIPPHLLGLSLIERPPIEIGREIAKRRKARRISQEALAEKMDRSVEFVSRLENKGEGLDNMRRRKALSLLLGIPPTLMGLADASIPMKQLVQKVDMQMYQDRLDTLYKTYYYKGASALQEVEQQIAQLKLLEQDSETRTMLYRYHALALLIAREDYNFHAIHVHSQACIDLAGDSAIKRALAHYHRAEAFREIELYGEAVTQIGLALKINHLPLNILYRLALEAGTIHYSAPPGIGEGTHYGAKMLSRAEKLFPQVAGSVDSISQLPILGEDFLALRRTMALVNDPSACAQAIEEARELSKVMPRRAMILDTYEADLAAKKGNIEEALLLTARAEQKAREMKSQLNLARVARVYEELKQQQM